MTNKKPDYERYAKSRKWIPTKVQKELLDLISARGKSTKKELQEALGVPKERLGSRLATLVAKRWISRSERRTGTIFTITKTGSKTLTDYEKGTLALGTPRPVSNQPGFCEKCFKQSKNLTQFADRNICEKCLNPEYEVKLEDFIRKISPLAECEKHATLNYGDFTRRRKV